MNEQMNWIFEKKISDNIHILISTKGDIIFTSNINKKLVKRRISTSNINIDLNKNELENLFNSNQQNYKSEYLIIQALDSLITSKIIDLNVN
jgi:hypothetical protein